jgi:hypothetical protein
MLSYFLTIVLGTAFFFMLVALIPKGFDGKEWLRKQLKK